MTIDFGPYFSTPGIGVFRGCSCLRQSQAVAGSRKEAGKFLLALFPLLLVSPGLPLPKQTTKATFPYLPGSPTFPCLPCSPGPFFTLFPNKQPNKQSKKQTNTQTRNKHTNKCSKMFPETHRCSQKSQILPDNPRCF